MVCSGMKVKMLDEEGVVNWSQGDTSKDDSSEEYHNW